MLITTNINVPLSKKADERPILILATVALGSQGLANNNLIEQNLAGLILLFQITRQLVVNAADLIRSLSGVDANSRLGFWL